MPHLNQSDSVQLAPQELGGTRGTVKETVAAIQIEQLSEKQNVWLALLCLEDKNGTTESFSAVNNDAFNTAARRLSSCT